MGGAQLSDPAASVRAVRQLTAAQARRIAVRAQLLDDDRSVDLVETVRALTLVQVDATAAVAPSADLVLWSRLGFGYAPHHLRDALADRRLVELDGVVRPADDLALYLADMATWPHGEGTPEWHRAAAAWVRDNDQLRRDVLAALRERGPLTSRQIPDTAVRPWTSSGWNSHRNVARMLELLGHAGQVAATGARRGRERLWDLPERCWPPITPLPAGEAADHRARRRLQALGIARARAPVTPAEPNDVGPIGVPVQVEGVRGTWQVDPDQLDRPFAGRTALLSPLDRLVFDRTRMAELFGFDYQLEMYKPAAARRWGYYALPVLVGDRLVGKVDAATDRKAGVLRVHAVHRDDDWPRATAAAVDAEIDALAEWLDLERVGAPA